MIEAAPVGHLRACRTGSGGRPLPAGWGPRPLPGGQGRGLPEPFPVAVEALVRPGL